MHLDQYISQRAVEKKNAVGQLMASVRADLVPYTNKGEFPHFLIPKFRDLGIDGGTIKGYGGAGFTNLEWGAINYEIAKYDSSIAMFVGVQSSIGMNVVNTLGDEEQKQRILTESMGFKKIHCFCLSEPLNGSDASGLLTTATKTDGGWHLNGRKRWNGNAPFADYFMVWARNPAEGDKVQCFVATKGSPGLSQTMLKNKYSHRMMQNSEIEFKDVFVPENNRLTYGKDFQTGTAAMLLSSRLWVGWATAGIAAGAYEAALEYCLKRRQFGQPIAKFQLVQEKLSRMLSLCEMINSHLILVSLAMDQGKCTMGQVARVKSAASLRGREVVKLAREVCGGNGIILDHHVMKALIDLEGWHTGEGTYEINSLLSGRELTGGLSAFK